MTVLSRTGSKGKDRTWLYHYSNINAVNSIITSGYLWLSPTDGMNDYLEGQFIQSTIGNGKAFYTCFSKTEQNLAMYKMYAPDPDGVMLSISYSSAQRIISEVDKENDKKLLYIVRNNCITDETIPVNMYWADVCYKDLHDDTISVASVFNKHIRQPLMKPELAGFVKLNGWEYEKEVRLCAITERPLRPNEKVAVKIPGDIIIEIITVPGFDREKNRKMYSELVRRNISIHGSAYDMLVDLGQRVNGVSNTANIAKHIVEIKNKIEKKLVDKSWVKTTEDRIKLMRDRPSQFRNNKWILKNPNVANPDINNGLIIIEPYDMSDDGVIVVVPRGDMQKIIEIKDKGLKEVVVFSEVLFRDINEIDEHGSINYPYPTLMCTFHGNHPFNRDVYYDRESELIVDESKIIKILD